MPFPDKPRLQDNSKDWYTTTPARPVVVCLCGSTRFRAAFEAANWQETLAGKIVLQPGQYTHSLPAGGHKEQVLGPEVSAQLEALYFRKIEMAQEVLVLNVGGYIGSSTAREIVHALELGKVVRCLEPWSYDQLATALEPHGLALPWMK